MNQNSWRSILSRSLSLGFSFVLSIVLAIGGWLVAVTPTWAAAIEQAVTPQIAAQTTQNLTTPEVNPVGSAKSESTKSESTKSDLTKVEPTKIESTKTESTKTESTKTESTKTESAKTESTKTESANIKSVKVRTAKATTKASAVKVDTTKSGAEQPDGGQADLAKAVLQQAYDNRYSWDSTFPGYEAEVAVKYQNNYIQGTVELLPDLSVRTRDIGDDRINHLIASQMQMVATQLDWLPFSEVHGKNQFKLMQAAKADVAEVEESSENTAIRFQVVGDRQAQPKSVRIAQLNRTVDQIDVEIRAIEFQNAPTGYIPTHWQVTLREDGKILERDDVQDSFAKVGKYYVLTKREIRTEVEQDPAKKLLPDYSLRFNNVRFLSYRNVQLH